MPETIEAPAPPAATPPTLQLSAPVTVTAPAAADETKEVGQAFYDLLNMGREPSEKKAAERKKAIAAPETPPTPVVAPEEPKPEPKESKRRKRFEPPPPPVVDAAEIASRTAAATVERMERSEEKKEAKVSVAEQIEALPAQHKRHVGVLHKMEQLNPERYAGIAGETIQALGKIQDYKKKWSSENPGKKFDEDDDEHRAFFELVEPDFEDTDYTDAQIALRVEPMEKMSKKVEEAEARLKKYEDKEEERAIAPTIRSAMDEVAANVIQQLNPEIMKHAGSPEAMTALIESDPDGIGTIVDQARVAGAVMGVASAIFDGGGKIKLNDNDPAVKEFYDLTGQFERQLKAMPVNDQIDEQGRRFATWSEWNALAASNRERYWILDRQTLPELIASHFVKTAQKEVKRKSDAFERTAKAKGYAPTKSPPVTQNGNGAPKPTPTPEPTPSPSAPSGRTPISAQPETPPKKPDDWKTNFFGAAFPR